MKILQAIAILLFSFDSFCQNKIDTGQFGVAQIGNVVFNFFPNARDTNSIVMRKQTANIINDYISERTNKKLPLIKLEIIQQDSIKKYGEWIYIYYVKNKDVFFPLSESFGIHNKPYIVISLSLYDGFEKNGLNAIKYIEKNYAKFRRRSKVLEKKILHNIETDEDMEALKLTKLN